MENNYVLITGVSGFLGKEIASALSKDYIIIGLDVRPPKEDSPIRFFKTDLTDKNSISKSLRKVASEYGDTIASVIHLAAYYDFKGEPSDMYEKLTVSGTRSLVRSLKENRFTVEQFLFTSTHLVMRPVEKGQLIHENDAMKAEWDYPQSKIEAEEVLKEELDEIKSVIFRVSGVYNNEGHSPPICNQIKRIYEKQLTSHFYPGDQEKGQPFVHVEDIARAICLAVKKRKTLSDREVFFIAEPELLSYGELQDRIGQLLYGREWWTAFAPKPLAKAGAYVMNKGPNNEFIKPWMIDLTEANYPLSVKKAQERLGFTARHRLYEELPKIIEGLVNRPAHWYQANNLGGPPHEGRS